MTELQDGRGLPRLAAIMERLLAPDGCPWDRAQTPKSLRTYVLEEAYEVLEAIDGEDAEALREELGDLMFQVVFQAALARRAGDFGLDGVIDGICEKMERRHPHVFGDSQVADVADVVERWEAIKRTEKAGRKPLDGVPPDLPALASAQKTGQRAARVGFDFPSAHAARSKVLEELAELDGALAQAKPERAEEELGDLLFSVVNWARHVDLDAESALRGAVARFRDRVHAADALATAEGAQLQAMSAEALDGLWRRVKASER